MTATLEKKEIDLFTLSTPEKLSLVEPEHTTKGLVELRPELTAKLENQAVTLVTEILNEDLMSDSFKQKMEKSFAFGRKEIADATTVSNAFLSKSFADELDSPAYKAISDLRNLFDELNPSKAGDLQGKKFFFKIIPAGSKLKAYLRKYQSAQTQLDALHDHMVKAQDEVRKSVASLSVMQDSLLGKMEQLQSAVFFIDKVQHLLENKVKELSDTDPLRAKAIKDELLYPFAQNKGDLQATLALTINAFNYAGQLRMHGKEIIIGCDRMATIGKAALSLAVSMARATGLQVQVMKMLNESKNTIDSLIKASGDQLVSHAKNVADFSANPVAGVPTLIEMFNKTEEAAQIWDTFRDQALVNLKANHEQLMPRLNAEMNKIKALQEIGKK